MWRQIFPKPIHSSVLVILGNSGVPSDKKGGYPRGRVGVSENWGFVTGFLGDENKI